MPQSGPTKTSTRRYGHCAGRCSRIRCDESALSSTKHVNGSQDALYKLFGAIVRSSPVAREAVLTYWSRVVRDNEKRSGSFFDHRLVASHSFMCNMHGILVRFAEPFLDPSFSKVLRACGSS